MKRAPLWVYLTLLLDVLVFFYKPLFLPDYLFPWDFRGVQLPLVTFLADQLRDHHFALWNPYAYCGYPVFANIEGGYFQPFVLLSALITSVTSPDILPKLLEWVVVLQVAFAGICAFHLFQEFGARRPAAWAGAVIFQTGGFFASRAEHIGAMMAVAWMPLAWLCVWKLRERWNPRWLAALGLALGMSVLGGFPQPTLAVFVSTALLPVLLVALRMARVQVVFYTACGCVLGILLSAVQFLPTTQLTEYSVAKFRSGWLGTGGGLFPQTLVSLVLPNHYNTFDTSLFKGPGDLTFLYMYCSILGLLLAVYAVAAVRDRVAALLAILAVFGTVWTLGDKLAWWRWFYPLLPEKIRIGIHPEYAYCILTMAIAGLAALGLERLRVRDAVRWSLAAVIAVDLFLVGASRPMNCISLRQEPGVTRTTFDGSAELLNGVRSLANRDTPPARIDTLEASLFWAVAAPVTQVPSAAGVSPLALADIIQMRLFLHDGFRWGWNYPLEHVDSPVLDVMNVKYVLAAGKGVEQLRARPRFRQVASLPGNEVFENTTVLPRAFLVHQVRPVSSLEDARAAIDRHEIDFRQTAFTNAAIALPPGGSGADRVQFVSYDAAALEIAVESRGTGLLVVSDNFYPGWQAWVDDRPATIHKADIAFRGVVVPDGAHRVRMEFRPSILWIGLGITLATALGLMVLGKKTEGRGQKTEAGSQESESPDLGVA